MRRLILALILAAGAATAEEGQQRAPYKLVFFGHEHALLTPQVEAELPSFFCYRVKET